jgi:hypothetical protein
MTCKKVAVGMLSKDTTYTDPDLRNNLIRLLAEVITSKPYKEEVSTASQDK